LGDGRRCNRGRRDPDASCFEKFPSLHDGPPLSVDDLDFLFVHYRRRTLHGAQTLAEYQAFAKIQAAYRGARRMSAKS
jgi:hypothetical protein